jgi:hypothetical protein
MTFFVCMFVNTPPKSFKPKSFTKLKHPKNKNNQQPGGLSAASRSSGRSGRSASSQMGGGGPCKLDFGDQQTCRLTTQGEFQGNLLPIRNLWGLCI